jgi:ribose transport system ATP-binding protein
MVKGSTCPQHLVRVLTSSTPGILDRAAQPALAASSQPSRERHNRMLERLDPHESSALPAGPDDAPFIRIDGLSKTYGPTKALTDVRFRVNRGEVLGLLGANGAGKSTLLNVIGGTLAPTGGGMTIAGEAVDFTTYGPLDARRAGVQRVFQELSTFDNLTVEENFALTAAEGGGRRDRAACRRRLLEVFPNNSISPRAEVGSLSLAEQQMVEIARAATVPGIRLLILDEPTSALPAEQAGQLGEFIQRRAHEGLAVIYVTHKLEEVLQLADRLVVLRDGHDHWEGDGRQATHAQLLTQLGAAPTEGELKAAQARGDAGAADLLRVDGLSTRELTEVSLRVRAGEIVGLAGLEGAGQRALLQRIFMRRSSRRGPISAKANLAYVSGDRQHEGLLPLWSVRENVGVSAIGRASIGGFIQRKRYRANAEAWLERLGLGHRAQSRIGQLSGGNQQRALLGRALASDAGVLLLDDPTRGVDVGAKHDIYRLLDEAKAEGRSALFYSTENVEFRQCDRVYVMARGQVVAEMPGEQATEERIIEASYAATRGTERAGLPRSRALTLAGRVLGTRPLPSAVLLAGMLVAIFSLRPAVFNPVASNLLFQAATVAAFAALAQMLFILGGDIDLGLGFAIGLVNVIGATLLTHHPLLAVLALLAVIGGYLIMALIVELLAVPAVVVTLGASFVWLGAGMLIQPMPGGAAPEWLTGALQLRLSPIPETCYLLVVAVLLGLLIVRWWRYGTVLRAAGSNAKTLGELGHSPLRARLTIYGLAAVFAIVTGLLIAATTGASDVNASSPLTLSSVAAVIVGGASFAGGRVSPLGAILGATGLALISSVLVFSGVSSQYSTAIGGIVLIVVLGLRAFARGVRE